MAPRLAAKARKSAALLDALAAVDLAADEPQRVRLGEQLDVRARGAGEVAGARDADALGHARRGRPWRSASVSPSEKPPIV